MSEKVLVDREQLERAASILAWMSCRSDIKAADMERLEQCASELSCALTAPAAPVVQAEQQPVAVLYGDGSVLTKAECGSVFDICCSAQTPLYAAPIAHTAPLRYTNDGSLAECPRCGSLDVGGAHDTVNCYRCGLTVTRPRPLQNAIDAWNTRTGNQVAPPAHPDASVLVEALEQFADDSNWCYDTCGISRDVAKRSLAAYRAALAGKGGE